MSKLASSPQSSPCTKGNRTKEAKQNLNLIKRINALNEKVIDRRTIKVSLGNFKHNIHAKHKENLTIIRRLNI